MRLVLALALGGLLARAALAQDGTAFAIDPVMARGPATAPVTLVEFSDYQ